jgi:polyferredoxin
MSCSYQTPVDASIPPAAKPAKKKLKRRIADNSQRIRSVVQWAFFVLNLWIGVEFYLFVKHFETGGQWPAVSRPPGVEGWLPIASLMNLKAFFMTGEVPEIHPAGMFLLAAFLLISLLLRKAFCSWLCPIGAISEALWKLGEKTFGRTWRVPRWGDYILRSLKYVLMGLFFWVIGAMSAAAIRAFLDGPYGVVSDVKMMNFFRYLSVGGAITIAVLVLLSVVVRNFWCRYLCPYGAMLGLLSAVSPVRIKRAADPCIDCAKCAKACPSLIPVDQLLQVRTAECTGCYECISACPVDDALEMKAAKWRLPAWGMAAAMAVIFFGFVSYAQFSGYWHTNLPDAVYSELVPNADQYDHP